MKTRLILFHCLLLTVITVKAQKPETAQAVVHYKFSHLKDTTKRDDIYTENMILFLGQNSSAYKSYDKRLADALMKKQIQEQMANNPGGPIKITRGKGSGTSTEYYQFPNEHKLVRKEKLINSYVIEEALPAIEWNITGDTTTFGGLHCQKATTHFKGRDYTAWFCPDLPFHAGPWKLNGLPGVIVDAHDAKNEVVFKFDGIEDVSKAPKPNTNVAVEDAQRPAGGAVIKIIGVDDANADPNVIELPADGIKTTEKEFANLRAAMIKDPNAFAQSAMGGSGANFNTDNNGPKATIRMQVIGPPPVNNPIELPEKK
jgi:GLPGLI family protein